MYKTTSGCFRDFAIFAVFLVLFDSLVQSGYGQQGIPDLPKGVTAAGGSRLADRSPISPKTGDGRNPVALPGAGSSFRRSGNFPGSSPIHGNSAALPATAPAVPQAISAAAVNAALSLLNGSRTPLSGSAPTALDSSPDPNFSPAGFRLHPQQPLSPVRLLSPRPKTPAKAIGKPVR